jgi:hypothetical protein
MVEFKREFARSASVAPSQNKKIGVTDILRTNSIFEKKYSTKFLDEDDNLG